MSDKELKDLHVLKTGLHGGTVNDIKKANEFLANIKAGGSASLPEGYSIQGGATTAGTLGRFTIFLEGVVTKDKKDPDKWTFNGKMKFYDVYDFKTGTPKPGDLERTEWGDYQTNFADKWLPGTPFKITSDWISVKQENSDFFNWFEGQTSNGAQNKVSNELKGDNNKMVQDAKLGRKK